MKEFFDYLTKKIEAGTARIAQLEKEGRKDDAAFAKVSTNIYDVCLTVTKALIDRPGAGPAAVKARFEGFRTVWGDALDKAREHGDARGTVVGEAKLEALEDVIAHFSEADK